MTKYVIIESNMDEPVPCMVVDGPTSDPEPLRAMIDFKRSQRVKGDSIVHAIVAYQEVAP